MALEILGTAESRAADLLRRSPWIRDELASRGAKAGPMRARPAGAAPVQGLERTLDDFMNEPRAISVRPQLDPTSAAAVEAIIRRHGRPVLLIKENTYVEPDSPTLAAQLAPCRPKIEAVVPSVGRIEFLNHALLWGGTGWVVEDDIVVTNRHVAELIAEANGRGGFRFRASASGYPYGARVDFRE